VFKKMFEDSKSVLAERQRLDGALFDSTHNVVSLLGDFDQQQAKAREARLAIEVLEMEHASLADRNAELRVALAQTKRSVRGMAAEHTAAYQHTKQLDGQCEAVAHMRGGGAALKEQAAALDRTVLAEKRRVKRLEGESERMRQAIQRHQQAAQTTSLLAGAAEATRVDSLLSNPPGGGSRASALMELTFGGDECGDGARNFPTTTVAGDSRALWHSSFPSVSSAGYSGRGPGQLSLAGLGVGRSRSSSGSRASIRR
jgi:hypothetical protein